MLYHGSPMTYLYKADVSAGSLMPSESRILASLLQSGMDRESWTKAIKEDNILQKKSPSSAVRQARLIRNRLDTLDAEGLTLITTESGELLNQMLLVAAIRHSRLLGDYLLDVYQGRYRRLEDRLSASDWPTFLHECEQRDAAVAHWSDSTRAKLLQVIWRILAEARYIDSTQGLRLTPPLMHPRVLRYLKDHNDNYTLNAMDVKR